MKSLKKWLAIMLIGGLFNIASLVRLQRGVDYVVLGFPLPWVSISSGGTLGTTVWERTRIGYVNGALDWVFYILIVCGYHLLMKPGRAGENE